MADDELVHALGRLTVPAVGGDNLDDDSADLTSYIQHVSHGACSDHWPVNQAGQPLHALVQIYLPELQWVPEALSDLALITVFIDTHCEYEDIGVHNGMGWLLRSYSSDTPLTRIPAQGFADKKAQKDMPKRLRWGNPITDLPDDPDRVPEAWQDRWRVYVQRDQDELQCSHALKVGGYPPQVQDPVHFCETRPNADDIRKYGVSIMDSQLPNPAEPEFAFQVASMHELSYYYMDMGIQYFARGSGAYHDRWFRSTTSY